MRTFLLLLISCCFLTHIQAQKTVGGVSVPSSLQAGTTALTLNGAGVREKYFMDMYVGALYLKAKSKDATAISGANEAMAVKLHIVSSLITSEKMETAIREGFDKSLNGKTAPMQKTIDEFIGVFKEAIKKGDVFDLIYTSEGGVAIYKNNKLKSTIKGLDFKKALFGIWLGSDPADEDLKDAMLGED